MFHSSECDLFLWIFHVTLRRMFILLMLSGVLCAYLSDHMVMLFLSSSLYVFCHVALSVVDRKLLKLPTVMLDFSISPCSFISFHITYLRSFFYVHTFRITMCSWRTEILLCIFPLCSCSFPLYWSLIYLILTVTFAF